MFRFIIGFAFGIYTTVFIGNTISKLNLSPRDVIIITLLGMIAFNSGDITNKIK